LDTGERGKGSVWWVGEEREIRRTVVGFGSLRCLLVMPEKKEGMRRKED